MRRGSPNHIRIIIIQYGKKFEQRAADRWVEESIREEMKTAFANYDQASVWTALFRTKGLFKRLALDVAATLGAVFPESDIEAVESLVQSYYETHAI